MHTVSEMYGRDITNSKRIEGGKLDKVYTVENNRLYIDIVYHNTDVGVAYYTAQVGDPIAEGMASAFIRGYELAVADYIEGREV